MVTFITNLKIILPGLLLINAALLFFFRNALRFVKGPVSVFVVLLLICLTYRFFVFPAIDQRIQNEKNQEIKKRGWEYINDPEVDHSFNRQQQENVLTQEALYRIIGLQTVFAFIFAVVGIFITPDKKMYGLYALGFFILSFLFLK